MNAGVPKRTIAGIRVCVVGNLIDGLDVLAIAFTAPAIAHEWNISPTALGTVFSAGVAGIILGSLVLAPLTEWVGRRRFVVTVTIAMAASMLGTAIPADVFALAVLRFLTGFGVGAILPTLNSVAAELAPPRQRNVALSIVAAAYPFGSILGGGLAVMLVQSHGWRAIFVVGAAATALAAGLQWTWLPASTRRDDLNRPPPRHRPLWGTPLVGSTALLASAFFFEMLAVFFVLNWTPRLLELRGLGASLGVAIGMVINVGSLLGGLTYGFVADRFGWRHTATAYAYGFAVLLGIFGAYGLTGNAGFALAVFLGFFLGGSMTSLYAVAPIVFPSSVRVAATGLVIGIGRCGGMLGPLVAAYGIAVGYGADVLYTFAASAPASVGAAVLLLARRPLLDAGPEEAPARLVDPSTITSNSLWFADIISRNRRGSDES